MAAVPEAVAMSDLRSYGVIAVNGVELSESQPVSVEPLVQKAPYKAAFIYNTMSERMDKKGVVITQTIYDEGTKTFIPRLTSVSLAGDPDLKNAAMSDALRVLAAALVSAGQKDKAIEAVLASNLAIDAALAAGAQDAANLSADKQLNEQFLGAPDSGFTLVNDSSTRVIFKLGCVVTGLPGEEKTYGINAIEAELRAMDAKQKTDPKHEPFDPAIIANIVAPGSAVSSDVPICRMDFTNWNIQCIIIEMTDISRSFKALIEARLREESPLI